MKKFKRISAVVLGIALLFSPLAPQTVAEAKVVWGNQELVKGQIGRVTVIKNTNLYNIKNNKLVVARKVTKGQVFRVYSESSKFGGLYAVSKDTYAQKSSSIKYEKAPSDKIQALGVKVTKKSLASNISYPQVSGLINKPFEASYNRKFLNIAKEAQKAHNELKAQEKEDRKNGWYVGPYSHNMSYSVPYNQDNILSVAITHSEYAGGAHGMAWIDTYNYDLLKARQINLKDIINNNTKLRKVNKYIVNEMIVGNKKGAQFEVNEFKSVNVKEDQFYYTSGGIAIIFGEYEYGPYSNGINSFKIPSSLYK